MTFGVGIASSSLRRLMKRLMLIGCFIYLDGIHFHPAFVHILSSKNEFSNRLCNSFKCQLTFREPIFSQCSDYIDWHMIDKPRNMVNSTKRIPSNA